MSKLYADYVREREGVEIMDLDWGFIAFKPDFDGLYLQDMYIKPEQRGQGLGKLGVEMFEQEARERGFRVVYTSVVPSYPNATATASKLLHLGWELKASSNDFIIFSKELK